jgi:general stress protein 26
MPQPVEPTAELNEGFSQPGATPPPWSDVERILATSELFWLSTTRSDGRPHVTPLPAVWRDGTLHFCTGLGEQKTANLRRDPRCILTTGTNALRSGVDVVVEGTAERVTDADRLHTLARQWQEELDWPFEVGDGVFHDGAGRTAIVFGVTPAKVLAFGKGEFSQTRYRFSS